MVSGIRPRKCCNHEIPEVCSQTHFLLLLLLLLKVGEAGEKKSVLVEVTWGESYPDELPTISLDAFFNNHL